MTKKIIAVSLVILLIAVSFVACGKDKGYLLSKDEKGFEHAYVTDAEGNTVLDDDGNIRVYQTDANGEIITDEDGNKKENIIEMPDVVTNDEKFETKDLVVKIVNGWEKSNDNEKGKYFYNGKEIQVARFGIEKTFDKEEDKDLFEESKTFTSKNISIKERLNNSDYEMDYKTKFDTINNISVFEEKATLKYKDGTIISDGVEYHFIINDSLYYFSYYYYGYLDEEKKQPEFDFKSYLSENLIIK